MSGVWMYAQDSGYTSRQSLVGFTVEAADGANYYLPLRRPLAP
ncbi:hypothetical protein [Streptomyces sp. NPDC048357]